MSRIPKIKAALAAALLFSAAACGGEVSPAPFQAPSVFPPPDASAVAYPETDLGPLIDIPGGYTVLAMMELDAPSETFRPVPQCALGPNKRFAVASFRLMKFETTNGAYGGCVTSGACPPPDAMPTSDPDPGPWDSPPRTKRPVALSFALAEAFCRHYGGELPTFAQWMRAGQGDDQSHYGIRALTDQWIACFLHHKGALCDAFAAAAVYRGNLARMQDVGVVPWDIGPYGNLDLFGNAQEWTKGAWFGGAGNGCDAPYDIPDTVPPSTFSAGTFVPMGHLATAFAHAGDGSPGMAMLDPITNPQDVAKPDYFTGFRCAFPPK